MKSKASNLLTYYYEQMNHTVFHLFFDLFRGQTALHKAALAKQRAISCMLVAAGASLSLADKERHTPRSLAERAGDADLAIYLESEL